MPLPFPVTISQILDMSREAPGRGKVVALGVHSKNFHKYQILDMARELHWLLCLKNFHKCQILEMARELHSRGKVPKTRYG